MTWARFWSSALWASVVYPVAWLLGFALDWRLVVLLTVSCVVDALTELGS